MNQQYVISVISEIKISINLEHEFSSEIIGLYQSSSSYPLDTV